MELSICLFQVAGDCRPVGAGLCARPLPGTENSGFPGANLAAKAA